MRRTSTTQPPVHARPMQSSSVADSSLDPVLQTALAHLDVQLEHELIRYRRQRALGKATYTPRPVAQRQVFKALDLIDLHEVTDSIPTPTANSDFHPTATVPPLVAIAPPDDLTQPSPTSLELKELAKQYASQVAADSDLTATMNGGPEDYLESSEELLRTLSQEQAHVEAEQGFMKSLLTPLGMGAMLLMLMTSALFGFVIMNPSSVSQLFANRNTSPTNAVPGDAGTSGNAAQVPQPDLSKQEFPELSLGNLGSIPPNAAATPEALKPATGKSAPKTTNLGAAGITQPPGTAAPSVPRINPPAPEPAPPAGDVPSPRRLAPSSRDYAPPSRSYTPPVPRYDPPVQSSSSPPPPTRRYRVPRNSPAPSRSSPPPARKVTPPEVKPSTANTIPKFSPSPRGDRPAPALSPLPAASASPMVGKSDYKVVTPYTSDRALQDYRGKVPDAYVKNYSDGAKVQFGAYQDESAAKAQVDELRKQGIPADIYKP